ncbi:MAG: beta-galactosidase [Candidatus Sumerlaeaceae bacterium]|nr:beta-galactosidase [Candidatus Sumerlaeaceae bacterium]
MIRRLVCRVAVLGMIVSLSCGHALGQPSAERPLNPDSWLGLNAIGFFHRPDAHEDLQRRFALLKELGVKWERTDFWWNVVEPEEGKWDFSTADRGVAMLRENGVQMFPILCYGAGWRNTEGPSTEEEREEWGRYVETVVQRYKGHAQYWEVWNEPNILPFWRPVPDPAAYAALLKVTAERARKANPQVRLVAFTTAGFDLPFIERVLQLAGTDCFDAVSYHFYRAKNPEELTVEEVDKFRLVLERFGKRCPIWVTEMGVTTDFAEGVSEELQGVNLVRQILLLAGAGVERVFPFTLRDNPSDPGGEWGTKLGLVTLTDDWRRKPGFFAFQTLVRELGAYELAGEVWAGDDMKAFLFRPRTSATTETVAKLAIWSLRDMRDFRFRVAPDATTQSSELSHYAILSGEKRPVEYRGTEARVAVGPSPVIIPVKSDLLDQNARTGWVRNPILMAPGRPEQTTFTVALEGVSPSDIRISGPPNWTIQRDANGGVALTAPPGTREGMYSVRAEVAHMGGVIAKDLRVWVRPGVEASFRPFFTTGSLELPTSITLASRAPGGALRFGFRSTPRLRGVAIPGGDFDPGNPETPWYAESSATLSRAALTSLREGATISFVTEETEPDGRRVRTATPVFRVAVTPLADRAPDVDGDLREYRRVPRITVGDDSQIIRRRGDGRLDASARIAALWTDKGLYVAADITDDVPMKNRFGAGGDVYKGDSLEIYVGPGGYTGQVYAKPETGAWHFALSPGADGTNPVVSDFGSEVKDSRIAVKPRRGGYTLEAFIPNTAFGGYVPSAGDLIAWDVQLNDCDSYDPDAGSTSYMWNGDDMNWLKAAKWGMAVIR